MELQLNEDPRKDENVVGWPPVKSWRKQLCRRGCASGGGRKVKVKVKMEGIGITRKIDVSIHRSFRTLAPKLIALFGKCKENGDEYKLMYQNKEGEWLHATDVPWECFIESVQRLKVLKE